MCQHMVARQIPFEPDIRLEQRGTEVAADCHFAFSYSYAAASEHMRYLSTPQIGSSSVLLQLCFSPSVSQHEAACARTSLCFPVSVRSRSNIGHSKNSSEGESYAFPTIWNELKPYTATVAWHGKTRMETQTEREWKAVGRCNGFQTCVWSMWMLEVSRNKEAKGV